VKAAIYTRTLEACKLALRRFAIHWLRKLVDVADDRLHAAEVKLRKQIQRIQKDAIASDHVGGLDKTRMPAKDSLGPLQPVPHQSNINPSAVKMAANLKSRMSVADACSAMRNLGFSAKEVSAVFSR
jgi:hypothetical protein